MTLAHDLFHLKKEQDKEREKNDRKKSSRGSQKEGLENGKNESQSPGSLGLNSDSPSPVKRPPREKTFIINDETEKKIKGLNQTQIARLQYQVLVLVMGLLEMRNVKESDLIMKKITQAIPREVLEEGMLQLYQNFYKIYSKQYVMAAFGNYQEKKQKNNAFEKMFQGIDYKTKQKLMKKTILESGFLMFFLISKILEAEDVDNKMNEIDRLNNKKLKKNFNILGDNILGKMANFITTFIKSILSYMKSII